MRVAFLLENSLTSKTDRVCLDASSFCPVEHQRSFCFSSPVPWSWECDSNLSRKGRFLHLPESSETVSSAFVWSENSLQFLSHHTATAMATSARKRAPLHLERTRVSLLSSSFSCAMIAWPMGHWAEVAGYLTSIPNLCSVSIESPKSPTSVEHVEAQKILVKQIAGPLTGAPTFDWIPANS